MGSAAYAAPPASVKNITGSITSNAIDKQNKTKTSYFVFPSQKAFFGSIINATKQGDAAILNGKWTIQQSRAIANGLPSLTKKENEPSPAQDHAQFDGKNGGGICDDAHTRPAQMPPPKIIENDAQIQHGDDRNGRDGIIPVSDEDEKNNSEDIPISFMPPRSVTYVKSVENQKTEYEKHVADQAERVKKALEEELTFQQYVHRVSPNSVMWKCDYCNYRDDKWGMVKHSHTPEEMSKGPCKRKS